MQNLIKTAGLKQKMLFPSVLYVVLLGAVVYFSVSSSSMIQSLSKMQKNSETTMQLLQKTGLLFREYINRSISDSDLEKKYQELAPALKAQNLSEATENLWGQVCEIRKIREENTKISKQVYELADFAIDQSNKYIQQVVPKLADESTRADVSKLETLVIIGANINTSSNYQLKVLFSGLQGDFGKKEELMSQFSTLLENVDRDIRNLAGTPFEVMAKSAKESILKMKELATGYIKNVEASQSVERLIFDSVDKRLTEIENIKNENNAELYSRLKSYFQKMLVIILVISLIGILTSIFTVRSVSKALHAVIEGLTGASKEINSAAGQLSLASRTLAEGASTQASSIEETSSAMEEMASMTGQNADNAAHANKLMIQTTQIVSAANDSMGNLTSSMQEISKASDETSKIIKTIDEIAFQTNLLALNAAVEAARAGEAGAGFAVVADEVRNLAMRAAEAAKNTAGLIESTVKKVTQGSSVVQKTTADFTEAALSVSKVGELIAEISSASKEQAEGIDQINRAVSEIDKVVQQNAAAAEESASASEETSAQAEQMNMCIAELVTIIEGGGKSVAEVNFEADSFVKRDQKRQIAKIAGNQAAYKKKASNGDGENKTSRETAKIENTKAEQLIPFDEDNTKDF